MDKRVYVGNLAYTVTWPELKDFMRGAGEVVHADILKGRGGQSRGCGIVEYSTREEAARAIETLSNTEFHGRPVFIREDREPPKPATGDASLRPSPPLANITPSGGTEGCAVYVGHLPFSVTWQSLKSLFRLVGNVIRADVYLTPQGLSRGYGTVVFSTPEEAKEAIRNFNGFSLNGRKLDVHEDRPANERQALQRSDKSFTWCSGNGPPSETLHVSSLPWSTTDSDLVDLFASVSPVSRAQIQKSPDGRPLGTGIVRFETEAAAQHALTQLDGYTYGEREIVVTFARYPPS